MAKISKVERANVIKILEKDHSKVAEGSIPATDAVAQMHEKVERDIELSETLSEAKLMLSQFYAYDWDKLGIDVPPKMPEFIKMNLGKSNLQLTHTPAEA